MFSKYNIQHSALHATIYRDIHMQIVSYFPDGHTRSVALAAEGNTLPNIGKHLYTEYKKQ